MADAPLSVPSFHLVVRQPFQHSSCDRPYKVGDPITDKDLVASILSCHQSAFVTKVPDTNDWTAATDEEKAAKEKTDADAKAKTEHEQGEKTA